MTDPKPTYTTQPGDRLIVEPDGTWWVNRNGERVAPDPEPCPECEAIGEHESTCRESPNWEPSDDDLDLNGERNGAEAERRALRDAGRDGGVW